MKANIYIIMLVCMLAFTMSGFVPMAQKTSDQITAPSPFAVKNISHPKTNSQKSLQINSFNLVDAPNCSLDKVAVDLILDTSISMRRPDSSPRINKMKSAVKTFIQKLDDDAVIGVQSFGKNSIAHNLIELKYFKDNKADFENIIDSLAPKGGTPMLKGVTLAKEEINSAKAIFPGYKWFIILLTDGLPNPPSEDPRKIAQQIKDEDIKIFTIGLDLDDLEEQHEKDTARAILSETASSPSSEYFFEPSADQLNNIYDTIFKKLCST